MEIVSQYAQLVFTRKRLGGGEWQTTMLWVEPGVPDALTPDFEGSPVAELNHHGQNGWELVGPPEVRNVSLGNSDPDGLIFDADQWVERRFWFKRPTA